MEIPKETKYGCLTSKFHAEVRTISLPDELKSGEILIRQEACNICTADYTQWLGQREHRGYPMAGGHEGVGTVIAKADDVYEFNLGDRIAFIFPYCGHCKNCKMGRQDECTCREKVKLPLKGTQQYFGFSQYMVRHSRYCVKISRKLPLPEACFVEPVATVLNAQNNLTHRLGDTVLVIGGGTMGLLNAEVERLRGSKVIVSEVMEEKLKKGKEMGFETINPQETDIKTVIDEFTDHEGLDIVILAAGNQIALNQALDLIKKKSGQILFFSASYPSAELNIPANRIHYDKLRLLGAFNSTLIDFYQASRLLGNKLVNVSKLVDSIYDLNDIQEAFKRASEPNTYRVCVKLNEWEDE